MRGNWRGVSRDERGHETGFAIRMRCLAGRRIAGVVVDAVDALDAFGGDWAVMGLACSSGIGARWARASVDPGRGGRCLRRGERTIGHALPTLFPLLSLAASECPDVRAPVPKCARVNGNVDVQPAYGLRPINTTLHLSLPLLCLSLSISHSRFHPH